MNADIRPMADESPFTIASEWLLRLQADDVTPQEFSDWMAWYEADAGNRVAFDEAQAVLEGARTISLEERERGVSRLLESDKARAVQPKSWAAIASFMTPLRAAVPALAIVASVGALGLIYNEWAGQPAQLTTTLETPIAKHRTEKLPDGSIVHLGARSTVSLHYSSDTRYLVLEGGEALFTVAKDAARPFVVQAGPVSVKAVGTEFNVRRAAGSTTVAVAEGVVEVVRPAPGDRAERGRNLRLAAGDQVTIEASAEKATVRPIQVAAVAAWQSGRLEFANEPLRHVVATVNRYSPREIVITDPSLGDLPITGTVDGRDADEWLRALPGILPVQVSEIGRSTVLISPADAR